MFIEFFKLVLLFLESQEVKLRWCNRLCDYGDRRRAILGWWGGSEWVFACIQRTRTEQSGRIVTKHPYTTGDDNHPPVSTPHRSCRGEITSPLTPTPYSGQNSCPNHCQSPQEPRTSLGDMWPWDTYSNLLKGMNELVVSITTRPVNVHSPVRSFPQVSS